MPARDERGGRRLAAIANEYATVALELDLSGHGPRVRIRSLRDGGEICLDPAALAVLCHLDAALLRFLADIATDPGARREFREWLTERQTAPGLDSITVS